jgi:hypothetical protein
MDMSSWILDRVLPKTQERFQDLAAALATPDQRALALAELADFIHELPRGEFERAVEHAPRARLDPEVLNHLAGATELAANRRGLKAPEWTSVVPIPATPVFGSVLDSVRLYLLTRAPVALRRRNLFFDASFDERV